MAKDKPTVPMLRELITDYKYRCGNGVGGNLHIVLEDRNVRDQDLKHVRDVCIHNNDQDGLKIAELMLQMSKTQRSKLALEFHSF